MICEMLRARQLTKSIPFLYGALWRASNDAQLRPILVQRDLVEYITDGIINFLDRQPPELSQLASDDVIQMALLREFAEAHVPDPGETTKMQVAAIQMHDGRFELLCLDAPLIPGTHPERITGLSRAQLAESLAALLPDVAPQTALARSLGGVIYVEHGRWLTAKRLSS